MRTPIIKSGEPKIKDPVEEILTEAVKEVNEVAKEYIVVAAGLNVRKEPNEKAEILKIVHSGDILVGSEKSENGWTALTEPTGYVMTRYIAPKKG